MGRGDNQPEVWLHRSHSQAWWFKNGLSVAAGRVTYEGQDRLNPRPEASDGDTSAAPWWSE